MNTEHTLLGQIRTLFDAVRLGRGHTALMLLVPVAMLFALGTAIYVLRTPPETSQPRRLSPAGELKTLSVSSAASSWNPADGSNVGALPNLILRWPKERQLKWDEQYYVKVWCSDSAATKNIELWIEWNWVEIKQSQLGHCDDDKYYWSVAIQQVIGTGGDGRREGPIVAALGGVRSFVWQRRLPTGS